MNQFARFRKALRPLTLGVLVVSETTVLAQSPSTPLDRPDASARPADKTAQTPTHATLEDAKRIERVVEQHLTADIRTRLQSARQLVNSGRPEAALQTLRLAQAVVRSSTDVRSQVRNALEREIEAQILATVRSEERILRDRAEAERKRASADSQVRSVESQTANQETLSALMAQFDALMAQGQSNVLANGGTGDVVRTTAPLGDARLLAQQGRALAPGDPTSAVAMTVATRTGFLAQELAYEHLKEYRYLLSLQDASRASVPFPDTITVEYPDAELWRPLSERRTARYGNALDLKNRDAKTKAVLAKLEMPISMSFASETPLEDVLKYIKSATTGPNDNGIPIYVDPVALQEVDRTITSPITIDLEGVPLKATLRLLLKQLGLTYTVKDGMLTITSAESDDQPTDIRVYPVADLAIIPLSLMGGGGAGGRGMGGAGNGGGMGVIGGAAPQGMRSVPPTDPDAPATPAPSFAEKKSN